VAIKAVTGAIKKARRMAAEFQTHVDELVREADLHEIRDQISDLRSLNLSRTIEKYVDEDGSIRRSLEDPLASTALSSPTPVAAPAELPVEAEIAVADRAEVGTVHAAALEKKPVPVPASPESDLAADLPAFIPPQCVAKNRPDRPNMEPPPFVPPQLARAGLLTPPPG
jgi:sec-independent protein translocase protein TatB